MNNSQFNEKSKEEIQALAPQKDLNPNDVKVKDAVKEHEDSERYSVPSEVNSSIEAELPISRKV